MTFKLKLKTVILAELAISFTLVVIVAVAPGLRDPICFGAAMLFLAAVFQFAIVPFQGFDFVIHNESKDSGWKYYWLLTIYFMYLWAAALTLIGRTTSRFYQGFV